MAQTVAAACHSDAALTRDGLITHIAGLLDSAPWMRRMLVRRAGGLRRPAWRTVPDIDLAQHVIEVATPPPGGTAGLAAFTAAVAGLRLPEDRPLWRIWVLPDLGPGQTAFVVAVHHALCDGPGLIELLGTIFVPRVRLPTPQRPAARPAGGRLAAAARVARGVLLLAADGMVRAGPYTRRLGPARRFAIASVPLTTVRAAARTAGAQPTDVVLAGLAGAVSRSMPARRRPRQARTLRVAVPVLARAGSPAAETGNRTTGLWVRLPVDEPDPVRRLGRIAAERAKRSTSARVLSARFVMERVGGTLPAPLHALAVRAAYRGRFFHAIVSVMPGSRRATSLGPGRILTAHPVLPLAERVALGLGGLVWGDALCLGLVGDARAVPDPDALLALVVAEIDRLAAAGAASSIDRANDDAARR